MLRLLFLALTVVSLNSFADMTANSMMAKRSFAPIAPKLNYTTAQLNTYYQGIKKSRALTDTEKQLLSLTNVATALEVENFNSFARSVEFIQSTDLNAAINQKIQQHPKWDQPVSEAKLKIIKPHLEDIKQNAGEKSYVWAWFLKQTGKTAEAKKVLAALFKEQSSAVMKQTGTYNHSNPMIEVMKTEEALAPLSNKTEKDHMSKKMQEMKIHVANLEDYTIMT